MSNAGRQWPQSAAVLRQGASDFDFYSNVGDVGSVGSAYDCGFGGNVDNFGDGDDSGYTEIPMATVAADSGLRDRIARLVFGPSRQTPQQPPPPPPPPPSQSSRRRSGPGSRIATGGFPGYAYTRWECLPSSTPPPPRSAKAPSAASACGSQRTVRFRCPLDPHGCQEAPAAPSAVENRWTAVQQPYSTFSAGGSMPALGERSASSGYGSDVDIVSAGDFYAVREEDIDRLLVPAAAATPLPPADPDVDVQTLDLSAFFPSQQPVAGSAPTQIDALKSVESTRCGGLLVKSSPREQRQHQSFELTDMRPKSVSRRGNASHRCYYK
ncbi:hypothetical protein BOX15_Mlig016067g3 [Macrostomum lignano]|uniref:Uncharacterized protein n=1 Tax=Macrostomum lignano TaxID=282301 RepID=A0A267GAQ8_9PLAT|nr:hypothetical protein BOX15_Mlig016067g3 [Macrostomum lignano]